MKIRRVWAKLFRSEGRTDMTNLVVDFRKFANAPKNFHNNLGSLVCQLSLFFHVLATNQPVNISWAHGLEENFRLRV